MLVTPWGNLTPTLGTTALGNQFQLIIYIIFILGPAISLLQIQETGNSFTVLSDLHGCIISVFF